MGDTDLVTMAVALLFAFIALINAQSCPAGTCSGSETCCSLSGGQWGCCPYPNADCCTDHAHCCPSGYTCDLSQGTCKQGGARLHAHHEATTMALEKVVSKVGACPAGTCSGSETCCALSGGQWGCCPYPNADCCTDHAHCCPSGYTCDLSQGTCKQGGARFNVQKKKLPLQKVASKAGACPAGTCPSTETCCELSGGQYGCCPYANADCCTDHAHCCPNGYSCDLSKGQCVKQARGRFGAREAHLRLTPIISH